MPAKAVPKQQACFHGTVFMLTIADISTVILTALGVALPIHAVTRPFVASIHLRLPPSARVSTEALADYAKNLPRKEPIFKFTTVGILGFPRRSEESLDDLTVRKPTWIDRLLPLSGVPPAQRPMVISRKRTGLFTSNYAAPPDGDGEKESQVYGIWSEIFKQIRQG